MRTACLIAALSLAALASPADAQQIEIQNGNGLYEVCGGDAGMEHGTYKAGLCQGYISGVADELNGAGIICYPQNSTFGQLFDIAYMGLRNHPEERHRSSSSLVSRYLRVAFACPFKQPRAS